MPRTRFGSVRQLPSGRFQARYRPLTGASITAPSTFNTAPEAQAWLTALQAKLETESQAAPQPQSQATTSARP